MLTGLSMRSIGSPISSVAYLEPLYKAYKDGSSIRKLAQRIEIHLETNQMEKMIDSFAITEFERAKEHIVIQLVNYERNKSRLESMPHKKIFDLAVVFRYFYGTQGEKSISTLIDNGVFKKWDIAIDDLYDLALENTARLLPATCGLLETILFGWDKEDSEETEDDLMPRLHVLSNQIGVNGATAILYPGELQKIADLVKEDLIILPSSIHETLLMKHDKTMPTEKLISMVRTVNEEDVPVEDILSDNIYIFRRDTGEIELVDDDGGNIVA